MAGVKVLALNGSVLIAQDIDSKQRFFASLQFGEDGNVSGVDRTDITETQFLAATAKFGFYLTEPMLLEKIEDVKLSEIETKLPEGEWYL
jgi:hypothetical protein